MHATVSIQKAVGPRLALAGLLIGTVTLWACSGTDAVGPGTVGPGTGNGTPTVTSVVVTPGNATLVNLGETVQLTASARNASGITISGKTFNWSSSGASIAKVGSSGLVTAVTNGSVTITATTDGVSGTALLAVEDPDIDNDGIPNAADLCPSQPENFNNVFDSDGCPDVPMDLYLLARIDIEAFWVDVFAGAQLNYTLISVFQDYTQPINTPCGLADLNNAFYCPVNTGVYYDINFINLFLSGIGDMAPVFIISHEIGHHVSDHLGFLVPGVISPKETELQADCFGGAWAQDANARGLLDTGDLEEAVVALVAVGDPAITWFEPIGHGTPEQRVLAFAIGFAQGANQCTVQEFFDLFPAPPPS